MIESWFPLGNERKGLNAFQNLYLYTFRYSLCSPVKSFDGKTFFILCV